MAAPALDVFSDTSDIAVKGACSAKGGTEYSVMHVPGEVLKYYDSWSSCWMCYNDVSRVGRCWKATMLLKMCVVMKKM